MGSNTKHSKQVFPQKKKKCVHISVTDHDLQIHIPTIEDLHHTHQDARFKTRSFSFSDKFALSNFQESEVKTAMAEAESAFDSMMEIRQQLRQAYEELMHSADQSNN